MVENVQGLSVVGRLERQFRMMSWCVVAQAGLNVCTQVVVTIKLLLLFFLFNFF